MPDMPKAKEAAKWIFNILDSNKITIDGTKKNVNLNGPIEFENIEFGYKKSNAKTLNKVNLSFKQESSTALVGQSGSGKSTIVSLIEGFYKPESGRILINGVDVKEIDPYWLRSKIGLVSQESCLFSGTIRENIAYGLDENEIKMENVIEAAKFANVDDFIRTLPEVYSYYYYSN